MAKPNDKESNETLTGTGANDTLDGLGGIDTLVGGAGDDLYLIGNAKTVVTELDGEGIDTARVAFARSAWQMAASVENGEAVAGKLGVAIAGNALDNRLTGNDGGNTLTGGAGNDTIDGGKGSDKLAGGIGDDTYYVDAAGDKVTELAGEGTDTVITTLARYTLAAEVENLVYAGSGAFTASGNGRDNVITGGSGNSTVDGGAGNDTFVVDGLFADYTRERPNATDIVLVKGAQRIMLKNVEQVQFSDGIKTLAELYDDVASVGNDTLAGSDGNDTLDGLAGADSLAGGAGDDTYAVDNAGDAVVENADGGHDTVRVGLVKGGYVLAANVEDAVVTGKGAAGITGNDLDNKLTGNGSANVLSGGAGNDTLDGGAAADKLDGGTGDDTYHVDSTGDKVTELEGAGTDTIVTALAKYTLGANVENLMYTGTAAFAATGNAGDNVIDGGSAITNQAIDGGDGNDTYVAAGAFADYQRQRVGETGLVLVRGTQTITLNNIEQVEFSDGVKAQAALFENLASVGDDTLTGTDGDDQLNGQGGTDELSGGAGDDTYVVDDATDTVIEQADEGIDSVTLAVTTAATFTLGDNVENATITSTAAVNVTGNAADNTLVGNANANALVGGDGNDVLIGGRGNDILTGGAGDDSYDVDVLGDVIVELADGGYDVVDVSAAKYTLSAYVEELHFTGKGNFTGIGNAQDNVLIGGRGSDKLTGGEGADKFVLGAGSDTITDFASGIDQLVIDRTVGNGDSVVDNAITHGTTGGFSADAELVIFTQNVASLNATNAAKAIGSADAAYAKGDTALFAVHNANTTAVYLFTSSGNDALVSKGELQQIATLTGVAATDIGDYGLAAQG